MESLNKRINAVFANINFLSSWLIRLGLGISFIVHGLSKFPLPPQGLIDYFGFSASLASFVAVSELFAGTILIVGGFISNYLGSLLTRFGALLVVVIMAVAFSIAHRDWFVTTQLFTSEQIFLFLIGLYFLIRGNEEKR